MNYLYVVWAICAVVIVVLLRFGIQAAVAEWREERRLEFNRKVEKATRAWHDRELQQWKDKQAKDRS